jgi:hypothetical protein
LDTLLLSDVGAAIVVVQTFETGVFGADEMTIRGEKGCKLQKSFLFENRIHIATYNSRRARQYRKNRHN